MIRAVKCFLMLKVLQVYHGSSGTGLYQSYFVSAYIPAVSR